MKYLKLFEQFINDTESVNETHADTQTDKYAFFEKPTEDGFEIWAFDKKNEYLKVAELNHTWEVYDLEETDKMTKAQAEDYGFVPFLKDDLAKIIIMPLDAAGAKEVRDYMKM